MIRINKFKRELLKTIAINIPVLSFLNLLRLFQLLNTLTLLMMTAVRSCCVFLSFLCL